MVNFSKVGFPRRQAGAVLFVALIMLILLTLIGVTGMQVTMLQERMSGNFRAQQQAFERGEYRMAEGRDKVSNPLWAYDNVSDVPVILATGNTSPWQSWLATFPPTANFDLDVLACGSACPERRGSILGEDPNKKPRFYVITAQEKDPSSAAANAAWATVQTIYVY